LIESSSSTPAPTLLVGVDFGLPHFDGQLQELELLAECLRQAQQALSEITGEFSSDDLLGEIFSHFCIGK